MIPIEVIERMRDPKFKSGYLYDYRIINKDEFLVGSQYCKCKIEEEKDVMNLNNVKVNIDGEWFYPTEVEFSEGKDILGGTMYIKCPISFRPYNHIAPKKPEPKFPGIKKVVYNPPATIVFWDDNTKTVVQCRENDSFDPEKGLAMAITKKALGNKHEYYNVVKKWLKKAPKPKLLDMKLDKLQTFEFNVAKADITAALGDLLGTTNNGFKVYLKEQTDDDLIVKAKKEDNDEPKSENGEV